jgi:DNA (cytosine-5)-methyltransferase 1
MKRCAALSVFTGAGGLDSDFEAADFETRVAVEMDKEAVATLHRNRAWPVINADIHSDLASSEEMLRIAELREGDADIQIGGPPRQA